MSAKRTRVLVVGTGPAALATAARLLETGGHKRFDVRISALGHHIGGKADSWRDNDGRLIDHGQHVILGWYFQMKALLHRAGVDVDAHLIDNYGHTFVYEERDGKVHDLALKRNPLHMLFRGLGYSGLTRAEKWNLTKFVVRNLGVFLGMQDIEQFDDICFTAWCLANGLRPSIVKTSAFRMARTAQLNWPGQISAYSMLASTIKVGRDYRTSKYAFCDGGMTEVFWEPLVRYIAKLGGELQLMRKLVGFEHSDGRVTGAVFERPRSAGHELPGHSPHASRFEHSVPTRAGTREVDRDFDHVVSTLPVSAFRELNPNDETFWRIPTFARIRNIRGVAPLALQIWHREHLTRQYSSVVAGLPGPLGFVIDNKHIIREYRHNPKYGAVLYFVGQETGYESCSPEQLLNLCLANVARLPGYERIDRAGVMHYQVIRHRSVDKRYFYTEPGIQKFRPHTQTPLANLWLAGDWVRSEIDFPCMEAAVRSGLAAADAIVKGFEPSMMAF